MVGTVALRWEEGSVTGSLKNKLSQRQGDEMIGGLFHDRVRTQSLVLK
jgi:hypothetical protein